MNWKKHNLLGRLLVVLSIVLLLATPVLAQTCNTDINPTAANDRYQNLGDGTVIDLTTKLMWKRCSEGQVGVLCDTGAEEGFYWDDSLQYIESLNSTGGFAGYSDWRLPNRKELESLVEESCVSPAINLFQFPNTPNSFYWSSSRYPGESIFAWGVNFGDGNAFPSFPVQQPIRLVRSSQ